MKNNLKFIKYLFHQSSSKGLLEWELKTPRQHSWNLDGGDVSYTSLRDVMSSVVANSNKGSFHHDSACCSRVPIKNRLVELAARAYLQPTMVVERNKPNQFLTRHWQKLFHNTSIIFNFKDTMRGPIQACSSLFSGFNLMDVSQTIRYLLGRARPKVNGFLKA